MKSKEKKDLQTKTAKELQVMLTEAKQELVGMQLAQAQRKLKDTSSLRYKKDDIARIQTIMKEKEMSAQKQSE